MKAKEVSPTQVFIMLLAFIIILTIPVMGMLHVLDSRLDKLEAAQPHKECHNETIVFQFDIKDNSWKEKRRFNPELTYLPDDIIYYNYTFIRYGKIEVCG